MSLNALSLRYSSSPFVSITTLSQLLTESFDGAFVYVSFPPVSMRSITPSPAWSESLPPLRTMRPQMVSIWTPYFSVAGTDCTMSCALATAAARSWPAAYM